MTQSYDTLIIGAGMSGLAAGIRLAYYDQSVAILERHKTIGGLNSFYRAGGRDYDVGLHAVTNFTPKGAKKGPLSRLLRQLRFQWEDFDLAPQQQSRIAFPGVSLAFSNDIELLESEIGKRFPKQKDAFANLRSQVLDYDDLDQASFEISTRKVLGQIFSDPLLVEMLLCPLMWYGNAREHDMDWGQFCIMFRSIFLEGFARPIRGVRLILKHLVKKYRGLGGDLLLRHGVSRIVTDQGKAVGVILDDGREIQAKRILSSAGWVETQRMLGAHDEVVGDEAGQLTFIETITTLDCQPAKLGLNDTIVFYNDSDRFHWRPPHDSLCDLRTGVVCSPNNYLYSDSQQLADGVVRITSIADFGKWTSLGEEDYRREKNRWYDLSTDSAVRFVPEFRHHAIDTDMFTPKTIKRFTWHDNGAVYGAPQKRLDGRTQLDNVFVCGTDQGFVGIVGAIISGISMANQHCLR
jgi:phytoene dehydrogenase-like protein